MTQPNQPQYPQNPNSGGYPAQNPGGYPGQGPGSGGFPAPGPNSGGYPAQPYPQAPPAYPGGAMPAPKPSGGTAITAGVLAVLGALWAMFSTVASIIVLSEYSSSLPAMSFIGIGLVGIEALLLLVGGILMFMKKPAGRWLVIAGCALVLVSAVLSIVNTSMIAAEFGGSGALVGTSAGLVIIVSLPAIATLVLAAVPPTARYLAQGKAPQQPMGAPGYPQSPQGW
ncbi:hypothetical protein [Amycolatopsis sp. YIM 10]|uniref:hypothetical protein n=1 Tax=Amycolatopsis sp. YIM 10 TaxID=2653857 RepID=UPI0012900B88|nr:hypothetical protein [Amycolatopsis sp. YIM 10]